MSFPVIIKKYHVHREFDHVQVEWRNLCRSANPSFFLCWEWIENWIKTLPIDIPIYLLVVTGRRSPKMAFFVGMPSTELSNLFLNKVYLNCTGVDVYDKIYIEFNKVLVDRQKKITLDDILSFLPDNWDEFIMPGLESHFFSRLMLGDNNKSKFNVKIKTALAPFVDLEKVRDNDLNYLSLLSKNTRSQIRRSCRYYKKKDDLYFMVAETLSEAQSIFMDLACLHEESWRNRGKVGCFSNEYFTIFHKRLILEYFDTGCLQLAKLCCGESILGCLYNFVHNDNILFYQSGLTSGDNNKCKPGLMLHSEMIRYNAEKGYKVYDFLAWPSQYKRSLSTDYSKLFWVNVQRKSLRVDINNSLRKICNSLCNKLVRR